MECKEAGNLYLDCMAYNVTCTQWVCFRKYLYSYPYLFTLCFAGTYSQPVCASGRDFLNPCFADCAGTTSGPRDPVRQLYIPLLFLPVSIHSNLNALGCSSTLKVLEFSAVHIPRLLTTILVVLHVFAHILALPFSYLYRLWAWSIHLRTMRLCSHGTLLPSVWVFL